MPDFNDQITEYRKGLQLLEQQMQSEYDKAILALSGGALGVSMTFLKDVVIKQGVEGGGYLLFAWLCWGLSVTCTLSSYYTSTLAMQRAVRQTDDKLIYWELAGGWLNQATKALNFAAGILFMIGVVLIVVFVSYNIP